MIVNVVLRLQHSEPVQLDRSQLQVLYEQLGPAGADGVVSDAMEEISGGLAHAASDYRAGDVAALRISVRALVAAAQQVGMTLLARVGRDVVGLSHTYDAAAFGATVARLERVGEASLVAVWDLQDLSI